MGVAGHQDAFVSLALLLQLGEETLDVLCHEVQLLAYEQLEVNQHLVVATAAGVYLLAHVAQPTGQHQFDLRVYVFYAVLNREASLAYLREDVPQLSQQGLQFVLLEKPDALEHGDVRHRAKHVGLSQIHVHLAVASDGEALYLRRRLISFVPQLH